jgi:hypothetical protein
MASPRLCALPTFDTFDIAFLPAMKVKTGLA